MPDMLPNHRQEMFCREYAFSHIGAKAARVAGYSPKSVKETSRRLLAMPHIRARIQELQAPAIKMLELTQQAVLDRIVSLSYADARKVVEHRIGPCRYCNGRGHAYQWTTRREYETALHAALDRLEVEGKEPPINDPRWPTDAGGFGYRLTDKVNPNCPECAGLGRGFVTAADTRNLEPDAAILYNGAKQGLHGIEIMLQDRAKPLEMLAKHMGLAKEQVTLDTSDRLSAGLAEILGRLDAAAPIRKSNEE